MKKRNELMAIMVGIETVLKDDPMLTCRIEGGRNPIRIICDSNLRIPKNCQIASSATDIKTIIASVKPDMTNNTDIEKYNKRKKILTDCGMEIIETTPVDGHVNLSELMNALGERGIDGILLEGGGTLNYSAVKANIVNQIDIYISPKIFGGSGKYTPVSGTGIDSPELAYMYTLNEFKKFDDDIMLSYVK